MNIFVCIILSIITEVPQSYRTELSYLHVHEHTIFNHIKLHAFYRVYCMIHVCEYNTLCVHPSGRCSECSRVHCTPCGVQQWTRGGCGCAATAQGLRQPTQQQGPVSAALCCLVSPWRPVYGATGERRS